MKLYAVVKETLRRLVKRGKRLGVIKLEGDGNEIRPLLGIESVQIFTGRDLAGEKPEAKVLERAVELLGGRKAETLWVGNSVNDLEMGRGAGVETVIFCPAENEKFGNSKILEAEGVRVIGEFRELLKIV